MVIASAPTEFTLMALAIKPGLSHAFEGEARPRTDVIRFESEPQFIAKLHNDYQSNVTCYVKSAPERIFDICQYSFLGDIKIGIEHHYWQK